MFSKCTAGMDSAVGASHCATAMERLRQKFNQSCHPQNPKDDTAPDGDSGPAEQTLIQTSSPSELPHCAIPLWSSHPRSAAQPPSVFVPHIRLLSELPHRATGWTRSLSELPHRAIPHRLHQRSPAQPPSVLVPHIRLLSELPYRAITRTRSLSELPHCAIHHWSSHPGSPGSPAHWLPSLRGNAIYNSCLIFRHL